MEDDIAYFRSRAEREMEQAQDATKPEVVKVHLKLAAAYLDRIGELQQTSADSAR
jgi:hypothetical protein